MNWSELPPLNSLRAFSAVAELGSYSKAGAALNVTHAAISQQVKALEAWLGVTLVLRQGRGMGLTGDGRELADALAAGFTMIHRGVAQLVGAEDQNTVQVTMSPAFAVSWMMPRITGFQQLHPGITLMLNPTAEVVELKTGSIDLAIRYRDNRRPGTEVETLLIADMVVVATPELMGERQITEPATLMDLPWLQELGTNEVADWMARHGVSPTRPLMITHMPGNLIMEAVRRGDGVTYTARPWVREEILSGQLVELFTDTAFGTFYIETRPGQLRPAVKSFVRWLKQQAVSTPPTT